MAVTEEAVFKALSSVQEPETRRDIVTAKLVSDLKIEDGRVLFPATQPGGPPLYFGGSSEAGIDVCNQHGR